MANLRNLKWKTMIAALYVVTALLLGFAHAHSSATPSFRVVATLSLPGGAAVPICGGSPSDRDGSKAPAHTGSGVCDACMLTAAPGAIPEPPSLTTAPDRFVRLTISRNLATTAKSFALSPQSRGPPQA